MKEFAFKHRGGAVDADLRLWHQLALLIRDTLEERCAFEMSRDLIIDCRKCECLTGVLYTAIVYGDRYRNYSERWRKLDVRKGVFGRHTIATLAVFGCDWEALSLRELADKVTAMPKTTVEHINRTIHVDPSHDVFNTLCSSHKCRKSNSSKNRRPCRFFRKGHCKKGAACSFSHNQRTAKTKLHGSRRRAPAKRTKKS